MRAVTITLPEKLVETINWLIENQHYRNKSEAIRDLLIHGLEFLGKMEITAQEPGERRRFSIWLNTSHVEAIKNQLGLSTSDAVRHAITHYLSCTRRWRE